jgi:hypothetical protein
MKILNRKHFINWSRQVKKTEYAQNQLDWF